MAASITTSSSCATNEQDRLGALPDSILLAILSFLPTLDAVRASVLSRRWRDLWTSVRILDLDDRSDRFFLQRPSSVNTRNNSLRGRGMVVKETSKFVEFVDRVLIFHHPPLLQKFRLSCSSAIGAAAEGWVRVAVIRQVREVDLRLCQGSLRTCLPSRLFLSDSLVDLKLDLCHNPLWLPAAMGLAGLRSMHLCNVSFLDGHRTRQLFSSCPALRSLAMVDCAYGKLSGIEVLAPLLQSLIIDNPSRDDGLRRCLVKISSRVLECFKYRASLAQAYDIELLSALVDVELEFHGFDDQDKQNYGSDDDEADRGLRLGRVRGLLQQLSCAKNLKICNICVEALSRIPAGAPIRSHILFGCLHRLLMKSDRLDYTTLCLILSFLVANPALSGLALEFVGGPGTFHSDSKEEYLEILGVYSEQISGVLEEVDIRCRCLSEEVLDLVRILLRNQARLGRLMLDSHSCHPSCCPSDGDRENCSNKRKRFMQKVSSFPRQSPNLVVAFL